MSKTSIRYFNFALPLLMVCSFFIWNSARFMPPNPQRESFVGDTSMTEEQKRLPENAVKNLKVADGLRAQLFASEPVMSNPTNIDIDDKGRVWVCEAYNYRPAINGNPTKKEGDRILILEDTNEDGIADKHTVFYQGAEIESPLGIWVMGNKVIVSQSPYVWLFTDENSDGKADKKEILLVSHSEGIQHDHGMHAFVFGPDGKYYFNFGNAGHELRDKNGNFIKDKDGKDISLKNYKQGMVFRCNPDMTEFEVMGNNFRNNYEICVDSYGTMWQSDNDDDGNKGVRINYVMDYGNYGYTDEITGAGWQVNRTNLETEIPKRHWHLNDPGVVPNLLQTGAGSPCGITVYEGDLLPEIFRGQMIHADAGPNVVRSYPVEKEGAGYKAKMVNILEGVNDQWFRPSDVCVAPDGSLFVADWYDPGVGGHQAGDQNRGRIFRVSPPNTPYKIPTFDYSNTEGAVKALGNPNLSVRWKAWNILQKSDEKTLLQLMLAYAQETNQRLKARLFWVIVKAKGGEKIMELAAGDENPDLRIAAIRAARQTNLDMTRPVKYFVNDPDPQVLRECALALRHSKSPDAPELLADLALKYDGKDRWYLEAIGIGADGIWDAVLPLLIKKSADAPISKEALHDIYWRSRGEQSGGLIGKLAGDNSVPLKDRLRYFRAFDFIPSTNKSTILLKIIKENGASQADLVTVALRHLDADFVKNNAEARSILQNAMLNLKGKDYLEFADRYLLPSENPRLLEMVLKEDNASNAAKVLMRTTEGVALFSSIVSNKNRESDALKLFTAVRGIGSETTLAKLQAAIFDKKRSLNFRKGAMEALGGSWGGEEAVLSLLKAKKIDKDLIPSAVQGVSRAWRKSVRTEAASYLGGEVKTGKKIPAIPDLMALKGDAEKGMAVYKTYCASCHQVNGEGVDYGPKLSEIGSKLSPDGQYLAILYPDAGISFGYEGWDLKLKDGTILRGMVTSRTETDWVFKLPDGAQQAYKISDIVSKKQIPNSLMPVGFHESMKEQELADLVGYLMTLKRK